MMKKRFVWLTLLVFVVTVGFMACGGTDSDITGGSAQQIEESEKQGIGITFVDPNYSECDSHFRQRALVASEQEQLAENEYLVTGENQIMDPMGNLTVDELQRKFEGTLTSNDLEEAEQDNLDEPVSDEPSRNLNEDDEDKDPGTFICPLNKFCVYVSGLHSHGLRPCVLQEVRHINISLMKNRNDPREKYWMNLHVGAYRNSSGNLCVVIFEKVKNGPERWCSNKLCSPTRRDVQKGLENAIKTVLASIGISVSAVAISTAAYTLSYLIYPTLIAL